VDTRAVPFELRRASGVRPFVRALVDGSPVELMVHANAAFGLMLTHDVARRVGLQVGRVERANYGISAVGELGGRGRTSAPVRELVVGDDVTTDLRAQVFDLPVSDGEAPVEGMLGIGWLRERRVVVDFSRGVVVPGGGPVAGTPLSRHPDWEASVVEAVVDGVPSRWIVSTVAGVIVDDAAVPRLGLTTGERVADDGGPTGTVVASYRVEDPWTLEVDGRPYAATPATTADLYAYAARDRTNDVPAVDGILGCDFMLRHGAVVDLASGTLALEEPERC
jgi:hypothetical protein